MALVRVVHVVFAGEPAGAERLLVDLATRSEESGAEHTVALMTPNDQVRQMFRRAGLRIVDRGRVRENPIAYLRMSLGRSAVGWVERILRDEGAQVAHLHTFQSHVVGTRAALRAGVPILRTEHDTRYFHDPSTSPFTRWSLRRTDVVVACSAHVGAHVIETAPYARRKLVVVRNGVDADAFAPRPELAPKNGPLRFVTHCRLEPHKQPDVVIRAVAELEGAELDVLGGGSMLPALRALVRDLGVERRVRLHDYVPDPRDAIARADVAISGSRHEPLGLSVLEALAMGKPVFAFAVGRIPEIVEHGRTGWLVRDVSAAAMARALRSIGDRDGVRAMGANARRFVEAECRIENMCRGYAAEYAKLSEAARRARRAG